MTMTTGQAQQILSKQKELIAERSKMFSIYQASGIVDSDVVSLLSQAGFSEAVQAYKEEKIGQAYFDAIYYCRDRAEQLTVEIKSLPSIPRKVFEAINK